MTAPKAKAPVKEPTIQDELATQVAKMKKMEFLSDEYIAADLIMRELLAHIARQG